MGAYVALLRGINVGGHRKVAMTELLGLLAHCGFRNAKSLLQSGNLVFQCDEKSGSRIESVLESEAARRLWLETNFIVRSSKE